MQYGDKCIPEWSDSQTICSKGIVRHLKDFKADELGPQKREEPTTLVLRRTVMERTWH